MYEVPAPIAILTGLPIIVSLFLLMAGILLPNCPCCGGGCGQDVYDEIYVTLDLTYTGAYSPNVRTYTYQKGSFGDFEVARVYGAATGLAYLTPDATDAIPERDGVAVVADDVGFSYSSVIRKTVSCINLGYLNVVQGGTQAWHYAYDELYGKSGCEATGVNVLVRPTCPLKDGDGFHRGADDWLLSVSWCDGEQTFSSSSGGDKKPTAPNIASDGQVSATPVGISLITSTIPGPPGFPPVELFPDPPEGYLYAGPKEELLGSGLATAPAAHDLATEASGTRKIHRNWGLSARFKSPSRSGETISVNSSSPSPKSGQWVVDPDETIASGDLALFESPCGPESCEDWQTGNPGAVFSSANWKNSDWSAFEQRLGGVRVFFFEYKEFSVGQDDYLALRPVSEKISPVITSFSERSGSYQQSGSVRLEFPQ